jgi:DNA-binding MarR family transcriptional regulator
VLVTLAEYGELQARQVTELTTLDKVQVSRAVAGLAERSLLRRRSCDRDSRASLLRLSESGLAMFRRIEPEALAWEEALLAPLQARERDTLFNLLDRLDLQLQAMAPTPDGTERPESAA